MSLRDIIAFPYVPTEAQFVGYANGGAILDTPFLIHNGISDSNGIYAQAVEDADGRWLRLYPKYGTGTAAVAKLTTFRWPIGDLYGIAASGVFYFGYRFKFEQVQRTPNAWLTAAVLSIAQISNGYYTALLTPADIGLVQVNGMAPVERYIEIRLDPANRKAKLWVDGVYLKEVTYSTSISSNPIFLIGDYTSQSTSPKDNDYYNLSLKDFYVKEVLTADDDYRLGPQVVQPMTLSAVNAPWAPIDAPDLLTALTTPISTVASRNTPVIKVDPGKTPAELQYSPQHNTAPINGAMFQVMGMRDAGTPGVANVKFSDGTNATSEVTTLLGQTPTLVSRLVMEKNPAGNRLSEADMTNGKLIIRPTAS